MIFQIVQTYLQLTDDDDKVKFLSNSCEPDSYRCCRVTTYNENEVSSNCETANDKGWFLYKKGSKNKKKIKEILLSRLWGFYYIRTNNLGWSNSVIVAITIDKQAKLIQIELFSVPIERLEWINVAILDSMYTLPNDICCGSDGGCETNSIFQIECAVDLGVTPLAF